MSSMIVARDGSHRRRSSVVLAPSYNAEPGSTFGPPKEKPGIFSQALAAGAAGYSTLRSLAAPVFAKTPAAPAKTRSLSIVEPKQGKKDLPAPYGVGPYGAAPFGMPPLVAYGGYPAGYPGPAAPPAFEGGLGGYYAGCSGGYPAYPGGYPGGYAAPMTYAAPAPPMSYAAPPAYPSPPLAYAPAYAAPMSPLQTSYGASPMGALPTNYGPTPVYGAYDHLGGSYASSPPRSARTPQSLRDVDLQPRAVPVEGRQAPLPSSPPSMAMASSEVQRSISAPPGYRSFDYDSMIHSSRGIDRRDPLSIGPHDVAGTGLASLDVRERHAVNVPFATQGGRRLPEGPRLPSRPVAYGSPYVDALQMSTSVLGPPYQPGFGAERVVAVI